MRFYYVKYDYSGNFGRAHALAFDVELREEEKVFRSATNEIESKIEGPFADFDAADKEVRSFNRQFSRAY